MKRTTPRERLTRALALAAVGAFFFAGMAAADATFFGCYAGAPHTKDGHIDAQALLDKLARGHMNFYNYIIYGQGSDWADLPSVLEAAKNKNVKFIVDLIPPSEQPCSKPFGCKFSDWSANIAHLSLRYPNLIGYSIDDFSLNFNTFGKGGGMSYAASQEIKDMVEAGKAVNRNLLFLPTVYGDSLARFIGGYKSIADGLLLYTEYYQGAGQNPDTKYWTTNIETAKNAFKIVIEGIYALGRGTPPPARFPASKADLAHQLDVNIMMYLLPDSGATWDAITGRFAKWNSTSVSGAAAGKHK